ncbi:uncharacterized protein UV8b_01137 [Ustilaginoidea virens]|uniref:Steroid 5-alpha reductase C-terminal domain-containing protein n=1 Tax=Ustilaginoidea virens TaxID=1159556 RepID=A0A8E5MEZ0_USTVR|nr:uncharacterized protein UV8b_01137 [Ustilaginoidea virens]QUC16896.1 hypothetical protein UV8b_01137 [Ustilaginoidea virens]
MADAKAVAKAELKSKDFVPRGNKSSSPLNTTLYLGLRALDCYIQYLILSRATGSFIIKFFGGSIIPHGPPVEAGFMHIEKLGLSGYRLLLLFMDILAAAKHFWFVLTVAEEAWTLTGAIVVGLDNIFFDTLNNLLFLCAATSAASSKAGGETLANPYLATGFIIFAVGLVTECVCEIDRKVFKKNPMNKGKPYTGGLFSLVRHPNYTAFTIWRSGLALASGGMIYGMSIAMFFMWDFSNRAVPALDEYCTKRYGDMWAEYKRKTPFTMIRYVL